MNANAPARQNSDWRPWTDPICLIAWGAYFLNRLWFAPQFGNYLPFLREHFNDSLLIPAALPLLYWARFALGLRAENSPPTLREVLGWCAVWSLVFEWFGPRVFHLSVSDWGDVAAYFIGGILAALYWNFRRKSDDRRDTEKQKASGRSGASPLS